MRGIGRILVMDRPQPAVADAALSAHRPQPGAVLAAQGPVGIPGIAGRSFLHRHPRWLFSKATPPAHRRKRKQKMCELLRAGGVVMEPLAGFAPAPGRKGTVQDTTPHSPQTSYRECNAGFGHPAALP